MKSIFIACLFVFGLVASASAQTVTNNLSWTVSNPGSPNPATEFRVEKDMGGTWQALATVPASQLTYVDVANFTMYTVIIHP